MKRIFVAAIAAMVMMMTQQALAQSDADNLDKARNALDASHNCDEAMGYLNKVAPANRQTADYLLCMARTQDCKKNKEQAIYYYNKYLGQKPGTDSVMKRVAELKDQSTQQVRVNNDERVANDIYQNASHGKKHKRLNLNDNYYSIGFNYAKALGGDNSPYSSAFIVEWSDGIMLIHNKAVLDISAASAVMLNANNTWFSNAEQTTVTDPGGAFGEMLTIGFNPVLVNKKNISLTVGAMAGINWYIFSGNSVDDNTIGDKFMLCYGIKSNLYQGDYCMIHADLNIAGANSVMVTNYVGEHTFPTNFNTVSIGVSYKFDSWWGWWGGW